MSLRRSFIMMAGSGFDSDARAYMDAITSTGVSIPSIDKTTINTLFVSLKTAGLYSKFAAIYPIYGGTASSHLFNALNPVNTTAAYRINWGGLITHSATGALPLETGATGDTNYVATNINYGSIGYYSGSSGIYHTSGFPSIMGATNSTSRTVGLIIRRSGDLGAAIWGADATAAVSASGVTDGSGWFMTSRENINLLRFKRNKVTLATNTSTETGTMPSTNVKLFNYSGADGELRECRFATIANQPLTSAEEDTLYDIIQAFNTGLGRAV